jgi:hypothetical protein
MTKTANGNRLSAARTWEYWLKSGDWGLGELEFSYLPREMREEFWTAVMRQGPRPVWPSQELLDRAQDWLERRAA